ncbi:hypothetical protein PoB_006286200 [Plakobranchus ocellatus]|uniref:Uncharacterized protein n=1 Tax=Plakobranchus ocellatus TaxID=259542 RepID=A0AAV4CWR2_9GAST|nr:hypothetical protein PoB_006286200 [Plakobranchus ocellatus]
MNSASDTIPDARDPDNSGLVDDLEDSALEDLYVGKVENRLHIIATTTATATTTNISNSNSNSSSSSTTTSRQSGSGCSSDAAQSKDTLADDEERARATLPKNLVLGPSAVVPGVSNTTHDCVYKGGSGSGGVRGTL